MATDNCHVQGLQDWLATVKLSEITSPKQDIVVLEHNQTVGDALKVDAILQKTECCIGVCLPHFVLVTVWFMMQVLARHRILSAPIVVSPGLEDVESLTPGDSGPSLLGWLDVNDVLRAFLQRMSMPSLLPAGSICHTTCKMIALPGQQQPAVARVSWHGISTCMRCVPIPPPQQSVSVTLQPVVITAHMQGQSSSMTICSRCVADLQEGGKTIPSSMLQLMTELEKEGSSFTSKMLITVLGKQ